MSFTSVRASIVVVRCQEIPPPDRSIRSLPIIFPHAGGGGGRRNSQTLGAQEERGGRETKSERKHKYLQARTIQKKLVVTQKNIKVTLLGIKQKKWATKCSCPGQQMRYSWGTSSFSPSPSRFRLHLSLPLSLDTFSSAHFSSLSLSFRPSLSPPRLSQWKCPPPLSLHHSAAGRGIRQKEIIHSAGASFSQTSSMGNFRPHDSHELKLFSIKYVRGYLSPSHTSARQREREKVLKNELLRKKLPLSSSSPPP